MSVPAPGAAGGVPAGAFEGSDPGRPPDPQGQPEDELPALEPGQAPPQRPAPAKEPATPPAAPQESPAGRSGPPGVLGQASPFARESASEKDVGAGGYWDPWKGPDRTPWWSDVTRSPYSVLEGLGSGAAKGEGVLAGLLHLDLAPDEAQMLSAGVDPKDIARVRKEAQAMQAAGAAAVSQDARDRVKALTPDANTVGAATQIIHGLAEGAELAITGSLAGGPIGAATAMGTGEGLSRYQELKEQGVDDSTALQSAGLIGVVSAAGAVLPGGFGSTLTAKVLTGAGGNVVLGGVNRYADSKILSRGGYSEMADQERIWDGTQILTDAVLGTVFGGIAHLHAPQAQDAARTLNTTLKARRSAPGVATDPASVAAHEENLSKATQDLMQGKPVDVSDGPRGDYLERPAEEDPAIRQALMDHLDDSDLFSEEGTLTQLQDALDDRMANRGPIRKSEVETEPEPPADRRGTGRADDTERRQDTEQRRKVSEMTEPQLRAALLTHDLTGLPNRRAYGESQKLPAQVSVDVDSLKWINDNLGHEAGDQLLKAVGNSLGQHTDQAYHVSGDEFIVQGKTPEEAHAILDKVTQHLADHTLEFTMPDGSVRRVKGLGVSYGVGKDLHEAEKGLQAHKSERESQGLRAARGEKPPGADQAGSEGGGQADRSAAAESSRPGPGRPDVGSEPAPGRALSTAAAQAVAERPHLQIPTPAEAMERIWEQAAQSHRTELARAEWETSGATPTQNARDALAQADQQAAQVEHDAPLATQAAVDCFLRKGG